MTMITVTSDVVRDLLPAYAAGDASDDTRALVEQFLRTHPDLRADLEALRTDAPLPPPGLRREAALVGIERTKDLLRQRTGFLAAAIACTLLPFSFTFSGGLIHFVLLRDAPPVALAFLLCAASFWIAYAVTVRRLRVRGL